ncbi:2002_t:CDS:2, partial [Funneliformis geosporum]
MLLNLNIGDKGNKPQASVDFQLAIFLRQLGSKDEIMSICSRFGVSEDNNRSVIHTGFQNIGGFQNVIGAIDRTHFILTETPTQDPTAYFTRKKDMQFNVKE